MLFPRKDLIPGKSILFSVVELSARDFIIFRFLLVEKELTIKLLICESFGVGIFTVAIVMAPPKLGLGMSIEEVIE